MDRYTTSKQIGDGTYGCVMKAVHKQTQEVVAIKRMKQKFFKWEDCINLREVQVLRKLNNHPNIVRLREVIREQNQLFFVFEYMDSDLLAVMKDHAMSGQTGLPQAKIRNIMYQTLQAVAWMHRLGYMHRDLKPENLLLTRELTKLADFGLAKEIRARPPFTEYVSTRWYRAPEVLLQHKSYNSPIDVWAAGCIMAELYTLRPLFPGKSEPDELFRIASVLGSPDERTWPEGLRLAKQIGFRFPQMVATPLKQLLPTASAQALSLMGNMLQWDPEARSKASELLQHPFFQVPEADARPAPQVAGRAPQEARPNVDHRFSDPPAPIKPVHQPPPPAAVSAERPASPDSVQSSASSESFSALPPAPAPAPERRALPQAHPAGLPRSHSNPNSQNNSPVGRVGKTMLPTPSLPGAGPSGPTTDPLHPVLAKVPSGHAGFSSPGQHSGPSSLKNARYVPGVPLPMQGVRKVPRPVLTGAPGGLSGAPKVGGARGGSAGKEGESVPSTGLWKWGGGEGGGGGGGAVPRQVGGGGGGGAGVGPVHSRLPPYTDKASVPAGGRNAYPQHSRLDTDKQRGLRDWDFHK